MRVKLVLRRQDKEQTIIFITSPDDHVALHEYFIQKYWVNWVSEMQSGLIDVDEIRKLKRREADLYARLMMQAPPGWIVTSYNCMDI